LTLPVNLSIPAAPAIATTCTGAQMSLTNTTTSVHLRGANIAADGNCTIKLLVQSASAGIYTASIAAQALVTAPAGANRAAATAALTVTVPQSGGGAGAVDWLDLLFVTGVVLAMRRPALRPWSRGRPAGRRRR